MTNASDHDGISPADELKRLRWQCRRGMLEMDVLLRRFLDAHYLGLPGEVQAVFAELLQLEDDVLWDLLLDKLSVGSLPQFAQNAEKSILSARLLTAIRNGSAF